MIGPAFGEGIWEPLRDECDFPVKLVKGYSNGQFEFRKLLRFIEGDVIFAVKPRIESFGVGLVKKIKTFKPLVLDIDDYEPGFGKEFYNSLPWYKKLNDFRLSRSNWGSYYYLLLLNRLTWCANEITVSGATLRSIYGGSLIYHVRDHSLFSSSNPIKPYSKKDLLNTTSKNPFLISFLGTPRPHKGLDVLIDALKQLRNENIYIMIIGYEKGDYSEDLEHLLSSSALLQKNTILLPFQPFKNLTNLLSITDLVVVPQTNSPESRGQTPAKIFDAMLMAKPIIATDISELPSILKGCGMIVEAGNVQQLSEAINYLYSNKHVRNKMGLSARNKLERYYGWQKTRENLVSLFLKYE